MSATATAELSGRIVIPTTTTTAAPSESLTKQADNTNQKRWVELIADRLAVWELSTAGMADDGFDPPTVLSIKFAMDHARTWMKAGQVAPVDIIPDGDGGILFKFAERDGIEFMIQFYSDGPIEKMWFRGARLIRTE